MTQDQGQIAQRVIARRYAVLSEIGRGGMGIVWLAEDRMIGRRVAIKELYLPEGVPAEERGVFEERVLREARTAGRLNDPAVVTVFDVLQEAGGTFIVMELIEAPTLADLVRQRGPLPQDAVVSLADQLLSALESAHAAGVVHRDVKPSNIMVLPNGRVKLTDFGIAQSLEDPRLTTSGVLVGSPTYMAPERIRGREADAGSDLWSLGAVLFCAVEGHSPFERSSTAATMHAIMNEVPFLTRCQGPLASVIMGLLINTPEARLTTPQVRGLLAQVSSGGRTGEQTVMHSGTAGYPGPNATMLAPGMPRPQRKRRWWAIAAVVVLLAAGVFLGGWFAHRGIVVADKNPADGGVMTYGEGGDITEFSVSGDSCVGAELKKGGKYPANSSVNCDQVHRFQRYGALAVLHNAAKSPYPPEAELRVTGTAWCELLFATDLVTEGNKSTTLTFVTLIPTKKMWELGDDGDQEIYCVLRDRNGGELDKSMLEEG